MMDRVATGQQQIAIREYSQDGNAILCDGEKMDIEEILARLRTLEKVRDVIYYSPELNQYDYRHDDVSMLNIAMCEAWSIIESGA
jgi:hypothetical protein